MNISKHKYKLFLFLIIAITGIKSGMCQYSEYEIKAAYIFNFAKFIKWDTPSKQSNTITLGIYKNDPFGVILEKTMTGRKANGKSWKIIRTNNVADLEKCQIVFFSDIERYELLKILAKLSDKPILTIGDEIMYFCDDGGIINFTPQFSDYQFEINNKIAKSHNIIINPKLLLLAKIISSDEDEF